MKIRFEGIAVVNPADAKGIAEPKWNQLFVGGTRFRQDFPDGSIEFDVEMFKEMLGNWTSHGKPALPVDYAHDETGIAAGWILDMKLEDGVPFGLIKWTDRARAAIQADELRYLSPTFSTDAWDSTTGKKCGAMLYGAALLNTPFLHDLPRVAAGRDFNATNQEVTRMDKKQVCAALGLDPTTADDKVIEELGKCAAAAKNAQQLAAELEGKIELTTKPLKGALDAANGEVAKLAAEVESLKTVKAALETEKRDAAIEKLTSRLTSEGRIVPAQKDSVKEYALALGIDKAEGFFGALRPVVSTKEIGISGEATSENQESAHVKLKNIASEISKTENVPMTAALRLAVARNPKLDEVAVANLTK